MLTVNFPLDVFITIFSQSTDMTVVTLVSLFSMYLSFGLQQIMNAYFGFKRGQGINQDPHFIWIDI
jgi:hypothetical protein